jgi:hypothetical protein
VPSATEPSVDRAEERAELESVQRSHLFSRSPALTHLLTYLCEKTFAGETDQIKEYSIALDVFERRETFDQDADSIVRVQANRLRKRLAEYYASEGKNHSLHITIPIGQYVPAFEKPIRALVSGSADAGRGNPAARPADLRLAPETRLLVSRAQIISITGVFAVLSLIAAIFWIRQGSRPQTVLSQGSSAQDAVPSLVGLPVGDEVRILAGASRKYVDHAGKVWSPDTFFSGGIAVSGESQHIWRTQDPIIYRTSRQGNFTYDIPLKPGPYELHLHFAEIFYGPESAAGGGEGSRVMKVSANGAPLLEGFDVLADAGEARSADVKVFSGISSARDGVLHLSFSSAKGASAMVSAIEILPGIRGHLRPVRIVARDVPYYSNDSRWWSPDTYFKGGQLAFRQRPVSGSDDPEFYESERWGHFSYEIPVTAGRYTVSLYFGEHRRADRESPSAADDRVFNVFCNGKTILESLNLAAQSAEDQTLVRRIKGLEPNAQGKLVLDFVPVKGYATVAAIEVLPE